MPELGFLPSWPFRYNALFLFGVLLLAGLLGGLLFERVLRVPRITGFVVVGMALGPSGLAWLGPVGLDEIRIFADIALGVVLFELGRRLDLFWLRRERWLLITGLMESAVAFALMYWTLGALGMPPNQAAMAAAVGMSTSPAVVLLVARDLRAEGQVTERAINLVAINTAVAFVVYTLMLPYVHIENKAGWYTALLHPIYLLGGSLFLGTGVCLLALGAARWTGKRRDNQLILLVGAITAAIGLAYALGLSVLLALLALGVASRNLDRARVLTPVPLERSADLFFLILFIYSGASLPLGQLPEVGWIAAAYTAARFGGKFLVILALSRLNGLAFRQGAWLGLTQLPMSRSATVLVASTLTLYPDFGARLAAVVLSAVALVELVGPVAVQFALRRCGEAHKEENPA
ncbi:MAG TPA: cation:proton antiporter [Burkholderiales bacterium]